METRVLIGSVQNAYAAFPPTPVMLHIKFDQDWLTSLRDIQVWKCEQMDRQTNILGLCGLDVS